MKILILTMQNNSEGARGTKEIQLWSGNTWRDGDDWCHAAYNKHCLAKVGVHSIHSRVHFTPLYLTRFYILLPPWYFQFKSNGTCLDLHIHRDACILYRDALFVKVTISTLWHLTVYILPCVDTQSSSVSVTGSIMCPVRIDKHNILVSWITFCLPLLVSLKYEVGTK